MVDLDSIPGCLGFYGSPTPPNGPCDVCEVADLCKRMIAKERMKPIIDMLVEIRQLLRG